ncbi:lytic murein transglycosylase [Parasulfuritortus cantonensis]|uniref:Lytic murein transglycosylase n=1 Tax=Parasulfuritortus cantonensis TaxID=2528202 RepID=A0A4R1BGX0_9PROT|nr:lytic transglycosylase domain-containing protein [Parasulfuritortus cantonensis]TCJ16338.1 lytic murein transglycosylase [Parasulfuritortus cantonensis]
MRFLRICCLLVLGLLFAEAVLASADKDFLAARDAYGKGRSDQFSRYAARVPERYPLKVYLDYWRLKGAGPAGDDWLAFADGHPDTPLSERLRQEVARSLGRSEDWTGFRNVAGKLVKQDKEIQCFDLRARLAQGAPDAGAAAMALWRTPQDLPSSCDPLFIELAVRGWLGTDDRLARLRLALAAGNLRLARELLATLPDAIRPDPNLLERAQRNAEQILATPPTDPAQREIQLYALGLLAKNDPDRAAAIWEIKSADAPEADQGYGWGTVAVAAARQQKPEAAGWFMRANNRLSDSQRPWFIRTMLRAGRWADVYRGIAALPPGMRDDTVWRYWRARALKALNAGFQANQLFAQLSQEINYYGLLAYEELPVRMEARSDEFRPGPDLLNAVASRPGIVRARLLHKFNLNVDAAAEWEWALRDMSDAELLAAAELARRDEWYDRAILTAEKTRELHSFDLRYLTPYRDLAEAQAERNGLDPAWVYGLMRQESRFVDYARSGAGARGLMQIMPDTAKWVARQMGLGRKAHAKVGEPETNIRLGTYYLRNLLDRLGGSPVLATAGYNAGPGRARRWQAEAPLEGAIYTETIPFTETREYVKKVLANAMYYSRRLGQPSTSLKDRLGTVPARAGTEPATDGDTDTEP